MKKRLGRRTHFIKDVRFVKKADRPGILNRTEETILDIGSKFGFCQKRDDVRNEIVPDRGRYLSTICWLFESDLQIKRYFYQNLSHNEKIYLMN